MKDEVFEFPPVTLENLKAGKCLIGDSSAGSPDFKSMKNLMLDKGYTNIEIADILKTHTIHHHQDMATLQLVPRDLHSAIRHTGGASIRQYIKNLLG